MLVVVAVVISVVNKIVIGADSSIIVCAAKAHSFQQK